MDGSYQAWLYTEDVHRGRASDIKRYVSGHGFSLAVRGNRKTRLQPLRSVSAAFDSRTSVPQVQNRLAYVFYAPTIWRSAASKPSTSSRVL